MPTATALRGYLTTAQFAARLGVSHGRVKQYVSEGRIPVVRVGGVNLIREADAKKFRTMPKGRPKSSHKASL